MEKNTALRKLMLAGGLLLGSTLAMAQSQTSGVITDANGEPLIGVTVMEQGTNNGTVTDNLTDLVWLKNANCFGIKTARDQALNYAAKVFI